MRTPGLEGALTCSGSASTVGPATRLAGRACLLRRLVPRAGGDGPAEADVRRPGLELRAGGRPFPARGSEWRVALPARGAAGGADRAWPPGGHGLAVLRGGTRPTCGHRGGPGAGRLGNLARGGETAEPRRGPDPGLQPRGCGGCTAPLGWPCAPPPTAARGPAHGLVRRAPP